MSYGFQVQRKWTIRQTIYTIFQRLSAPHELRKINIKFQDWIISDKLDIRISKVSYERNILWFLIVS